MKTTRFTSCRVDFERKVSMKSFKYALEEGTKYLIKHNIDNAKVDAWHLFSHLININRAEYFLYSDKEISNLQYNQYMELIKKERQFAPPIYYWLSRLYGIKD